MAATMNSTVPTSVRTKPSVLIVEDEPSVLETVRFALGRSDLDCAVLAASSISEAKRILDAQPVQVVLLDVNLPDGDGMSLVPVIREKHPTAQSVVLTGNASIDGAIGAIRAGVSDFVQKPFDPTDLCGRVDRALKRQAMTQKVDVRLDRLRRAVRRLNISRRTVSKKVDLLCNDLISAYGELSKQVDVIRTQESFRKLANGAKDLEQLLCHAMDWVLRHAGYSNVAVWLASDHGESELGAYMKYTIAGEKEFTEAMKEGLLPIAHREGFVHLSSDEIAAQLTETEVKYLSGQTLMAVNCTYLGETLATFVAFRDARSPFTEEDGAMLKAISPLFAIALASVVRKADGELDDVELDEDGNPFYDDANGAAKGGLADDEDEEVERKRRERERKKKEDQERHAADWWKRGEPPPF